MPDLQTSLDNVGSITKALLNALDQIEQYVAASQIGSDGNPSKTAIYMHMPIGHPIDPKMYANPWTPGGGDSAASFSNEGTLVAPTTPAAAAGTTANDGKGPAGSVYPPPKVTPDPQLQASIQNAMYTSNLVDNMLEITQKGIAVAWPERRVSVEYFTVIHGMQPEKIDPPAQDVLDRVKAAQGLLYLKDDKGNFVGYTPLYAQYRRNQKAWTDAVGAQAAAYARAMSDPVLGQEWPVEAATYANAVTQAWDDFNAMGKKEVEDALNTIATVGENAVAALAALALQLYDAYKVQLGGAISVGIPWSYIDPISWWDHTDDSFGVQQITASSSQYDASGGSSSSSFANNWWNQQSSSTSAKGRVGFGFLGGGSADYSHAEASNAFADQSGSSSMSHYSDKASKASVKLEFFLATIERPWLLGDVFNIEGWYLAGQKKNSISDGTIANQAGDTAKLLPMIPKAFLIIRNLEITADDWGDAGSAFEKAQADSSGSGESRSNSYGVSASYLFSNGSVQHSDQQASGAFGSTASKDAGWSFERTAEGGTLKLMGSQIVGWVGEIQPPAPKIDDPTLTSSASTTGGSSGTNKPPATS